MTPGRWSHVPALAQRWFKLFVSGCLGKLKVSCDIHVRFWIHYFRPRFLRSWCLRSFQGDLKHKLLPFCFNLITSMCVCVLERVSAARIQCLLQSQKSGEVPCEHLSDVFVFVLILSVGLGTSQSGQIREFWHLWPPLLWLVELKRTPGPGDVHFLGDLKHSDGHLRRTWVILTILTTHHSSWLDKASRMNKW